MMHWGAVLANMDAFRAEGAPVQFAPLGGAPLFMHALRAFLAVPGFARVYVCAPEGWVRRAQAALADALHDEQAARVRVLECGDSAAQALYRVCRDIRADSGADGTLVAHDALRPFVNAAEIEGVLRAAADCAVCTAAYPTNRAVLAVYEANYVAAMPEPETLYFGRTPLAFSLASYLDLGDDLSDADWARAEDPCRLFVRNGYPVKLLASGADDLRIDMPIAYRAVRALEGELF